MLRQKLEFSLHPAGAPRRRGRAARRLTATRWGPAMPATSGSTVARALPRGVPATGPGAKPSAGLTTALAAPTVSPALSTGTTPCICPKAHSGQRIRGWGPSYSRRQVAVPELVPVWERLVPHRSPTASPPPAGRPTPPQRQHPLSRRAPPRPAGARPTTGSHRSRRLRPHQLGCRTPPRPLSG
jgi:hypothetical protein